MKLIKRISLVIALALSLALCLCLAGCNEDNLPDVTLPTESSQKGELPDDFNGGGNIPGKPSDDKNDHGGNGNNGNNDGVIDTITITFSQGDGYPDIVRKIKKGEALIDIPVPKDVEGYFLEWEEIDFEALTSDIIVHIIKRPKNCKITFSQGDGYPDIEFSVPLGQSFEDIPDPKAVEGYEIRWEAKDLTNVQGNIVVYAVKTPIPYSITYYLDGGKNHSDNIFSYDITTEFTFKQPTKQGYDFQGWFEDQELSRPISKIHKGSLGSLNLYAKWSVGSGSGSGDSEGGGGNTPTKYVTVTFDSKGGTPVDSQNVIINHTAEKPQNPTKEGYTFDGWYYEGEEWSFIGFNVSDDITLYAKWTAKKYTISYVLNEGVNNENAPTEYTIETGAELFAPTRDGYTFDGWYFDEGFENIAERISKGTSGDITLYAKWTAKKYTISYVLNEGVNNENAPTEYTIETGAELFVPTRDGYTFDGWYYDEGFENIAERISKGASGDITLYAKWVANINTITFMPNGAPGKASYQTVRTGETVKLTKNTYIYENYTFLGWAYSEDSETANMTDEEELTMKPNGSLYLYAVWKKNTITVTIDPNGAEGKMDELTVTPGVPFALPENTIEYEGYAPLPNYHWEILCNTCGSSSSCISQSTGSAGQSITLHEYHSYTLVAKWIVVKYYTVLFNPANGTVDKNTVTVNNVYPIGELPVPTREGYTFDGWYRSCSYKNRVDEATVFNGNQTLYAKWTGYNKPDKECNYTRGENIANQANIIVVSDTMFWACNPSYLVDGNIETGTHSTKSTEFSYLFKFDGKKHISEIVVYCNGKGRLPMAGTVLEETVFNDYDVQIVLYNQYDEVVFESPMTNVASIVALTQNADAYAYSVEIKVNANDNESALFGAMLIWEIEIYDSGSAAHGFEQVDTVVPSCSYEGARLYECSCGANKYELMEKASVHSYKLTGQAEHMDIYTCSLCNDEKRLSTYSAHSWDKGTTVAPGCTSDGYVLYSCTDEGCGATYKSAYINAIGHNYEIDSMTRLEGGKDLLIEYTCKRDGCCEKISRTAPISYMINSKELTKDNILSTSASFSEDKIDYLFDGECEGPYYIHGVGGETSFWYGPDGTRAEILFDSVYAITSLNIYVAANYCRYKIYLMVQDEDGNWQNTLEYQAPAVNNSEAYKMSFESELGYGIPASKLVIEVVSAKWENGISMQFREVEIKAHSCVFDEESYNFDKEYVPATCTQDGFAWANCSICCKESYERLDKDKFGHSFGDTVVDREPTVDENGAYHRECTDCGYEDRGELTLDCSCDSLDYTVIKEATKEQSGICAVVCHNCGEILCYYTTFYEE